MTKSVCSKCGREVTLRAGKVIIHGTDWKDVICKGAYVTTTKS